MASGVSLITVTSPIPIEVTAMPWHLEYGNAECSDDQWAVVKDADGTVAGCHDTRADAVSQMQALYAQEPSAQAETVTAAAEVAGGAMVAFIPSQADAGRLALEGGEPLDQLHCTSVYLGDAADYDPPTQARILSDVTTAAGALKPFEAEAFASALFNPNGDEPCLTFCLSGAELAGAQSAIRAAVGVEAPPAAHQPWIPHITLAYDSDPAMLLGPEVFDRLGPVTFDRVRVAFGGSYFDVPLGEAEPAAESPDETQEPPSDDEMSASIVAAMAIGTPWRAVVLREGVWSGDGRQFAPDALTFAPLPFPLKWQPAEGDGHGGAVIVGRVDMIAREGDLIIAEGIFDDAGANGAEALRLRRGDFLRGISLMVDDIDETDIEYVMPEMEPLPGEPMDMLEEIEPIEAPEIEAPESVDSVMELPAELPALEPEAEGPEIEITVTLPEPVSAPPMMPHEMMDCREIYHAGRVRSLTLVAEPAFIESELMLIEVAEPTPTSITVAAGYTITIPELWPESWFEEPAPEDMPAFGALRITASGRITGWLAPPGVVHRAFRASGRPVTVPTRIDYSEFNNKPALVASRDGSVATINAGNITFNCGHPDPGDPRRASASWAREVYDNSCSVVARVRIWESPAYPGAPIVAGALLHGVDADAIERMMGCALSGDWQGGKLNAALLVPVEGFPTAVGSSVRVREGQIIASSVPVTFEPRGRDKLEALARRIGMDHASQFAKLRERITPKGI